MIMRAISILLAAVACAALWFGYMNLNLLRGTPFFDFRYVVFAVGAFLALSALEWAVAWLKTKLEPEDADH